MHDNGMANQCRHEDRLLSKQRTCYELQAKCSFRICSCHSANQSCEQRLASYTLPGRVRMSSECKETGFLASPAVRSRTNMAPEDDPSARAMAGEACDKPSSKLAFSSGICFEGAEQAAAWSPPR